MHHFSASAGSLRIVLLALLGGACGGAAPTSPRVDAPPPAQATDSGLPDSGWGELELANVPAVLTLPDRSYWRASVRGTFVELEHSGSASRITLRLWRAPRLVRPHECEAEVRLARRDLPRATPDTELERTRVDYPRGFDAELSVAVEPHARGARGHVTLVGAATGRCLFIAFETVVSGAQAAAQVADRLTVVVEGILPRVRIPSVDARAGGAPAE